MKELFEAVQNNPLSSALLAILFSLLGVFVGNRQAIDRDRRKEFNAVAERVRPILERQLTSVTPNSNYPSSEDFGRLSHMLYPWQRARFLKAVESYKTTRGDWAADEIGQAHYSDTAQITDSIVIILRLIPYR